MELENLSKEQLLALLKTTGLGKPKNEVKKKVSHHKPPAESTLDSGEKRCQYFNSRGIRKQCENAVETEWGFCQRHIKTVQSRHCERVWKESNKIEPPKVVDDASSDEDDRDDDKGGSGGSGGSDNEKELDTEDTKIVKTDTIKETSSRNPPHPIRNDFPSRDEVTKSPPHKSLNKKPPKKIIKKSDNCVTRVRQNRWGNYEHLPTQIVFDYKTKTAYGIQHNNGKVYPLLREDMKVCDKYGWKYQTYVSDDESDYSEHTLSDGSVD